MLLAPRRPRLKGRLAESRALQKGTACHSPPAGRRKGGVRGRAARRDTRSKGGGRWPRERPGHKPKRPFAGGKKSILAEGGREGSVRTWPPDRSEGGGPRERNALLGRGGRYELTEPRKKKSWRAESERLNAPVQERKRKEKLVRKNEKKKSEGSFTCPPLRQKRRKGREA